jgi:hypothetical protein
VLLIQNAVTAKRKIDELILLEIEHDFQKSFGAIPVSTFLLNI